MISELDLSEVAIQKNPLEIRISSGIRARITMQNAFRHFDKIRTNYDVDDNKTSKIWENRKVFLHFFAFSGPFREFLHYS